MIYGSVKRAFSLVPGNPTVAWERSAAIRKKNSIGTIEEENFQIFLRSGSLV